MPTFNVSKGKVAAQAERVATNEPATSGFVVVLLKVAEADSVLEDYDTLAALLANNTEAHFTNYARKTLTDADITNPTPDDTTNNQTVTGPTITWTSAGGTLDNTLTTAVFCFASDVAGADSTLIPSTFHAFSGTTNGNNLNLQIPNGFFVAS